MKTAHITSVLFLLTVCLHATTAQAQNIVNDTLVVSTTATVELVFPSQPGAKFSTADGSYEADGGTKKSLVIRARKKDVDPQSLTVTEGPRTHHFVLVYSEDAPPLRRDWSKQKNLAAHVNDMKGKATAGLAEADAAFDKGEYDRALPIYGWVVNNVEEAERGPIRSRIDECTQHSELTRQKNFKDALAQAKAFETASKFKEADGAYIDALRLFPTDADAQGKRQRSKDNWYKVSTARGDSADAKKNFALAITFYKEAMLADMEKFTRAYKEKYKRVLADAGDDAFDLHDWSGAKQAYETVLGTNKNDDHCTKRLDKIKEAEAKEHEAKAKEADYYRLLSSAKYFANAKNFDAAIAKYNEAAALFPGLHFAKEKRDALKSNASAKR